MASTTVSPTRIDFRTTHEVKGMIEQAAAINGLTVSEFIKVTMIAKSHEILAQHEMRVLSDRDRDTFLALLEEPAQPNAALRAAAARYKRAVRDGSLIP
jgi:uncharacterized protein (DUF1778 family)